MKFTLIALICTTTFCGAMPAFADNKAAQEKHGLTHKLVKLTGDTALLPADLVIAPMMMTMVCHCMLPWPPNSRSKGEYGNSWRYAVFVPCFDAVIVSAAPVLLGTYQIGSIATDVRAIFAPTTAPQSPAP